jgi:hypothetical protein
MKKHRNIPEEALFVPAANFLQQFVEDIHRIVASIARDITCAVR